MDQGYSQPIGTLYCKAVVDAATGTATAQDGWQNPPGSAKAV